MWPCLLFYFQMDDYESEDPDQSVDELQQTDEAQSWIGVIHIPASEYYNSHGSKSCSFLDRVCIFVVYTIEWLLLSGWTVVCNFHDACISLLMAPMGGLKGCF